MSTMSASREAHNGCRVLFNHSQGWAYMGPSGHVNPKEFPGTVSYGRGRDKVLSAGRGKERPRGCRGADGVSVQGDLKRPLGNNPARTQTGRSGHSLARKTNEVLSAFFDGACLDSSVTEGGTQAMVEDDGSGTVADGEGGEEDGSGCSRKGIPIVLTLQAILTGRSSCTVGRSRVEPSASTVEESSDPCGDSDRLPEVSGDAQFPPLSSPDLFLAPPIVVKPEAGDSVGGGLSCAEVVAASSVIATETASSMARPTGSGGVDGGGDPRGGGNVAEMSRVGWWLRWAVAGGSAAAPAATAAAGNRGDSGSSSRDLSSGDIGSVPDGSVSYEMRGGSDGWELVSVDSGAADGDIILSPASRNSRLPRLGDALPSSPENPASPMPNGDGNESTENDTDECASSWDYCGMSDVGVSDLVRGTVGQILEPRRVDLERREGSNVDIHGEGNHPVAEEAAPRMSYRDVLMMANFRGQTDFSLPPSVLAKRLERRTLRFKCPPRLIPETGMYLWRQVASGMGRPRDAGKSDDGEDTSDDDDCEYYARKEWGAMSFAKRPRGRDHK